MNLSDALLPHARDPRIAPHLFGAAPAWLWSTDGARILWANAAAAAAMGAGSPAAAAARRIEPQQALARDIARLAASLPASGAAQLARLRGLVPGLARMATCTCLRMRLPDIGSAVLIVSLDAPRPALPLAERVARIFDDAVDGLAFAPDGSLLFAGKGAGAHLGGESNLEALGAADAAAEAVRSGSAETAISAGTLRLERAGGGDAVVLLATLTPATENHQALAEAPAPADDAADTPADVSDEEPPAIASLEAAAEAPGPDAIEKPTVAREQEAAAEEPHERISSNANAEHASETSEAPEAPAVASVEPAENPSTEPAEPLFAALAQAEARLVERRHPLRFVWLIDVDNRFSIEPGEFVDLAGKRSAAVQGKPWSEVTQSLDIDREGRLARAIASHDTFSGITVQWPADGAIQRLPVLLSGLPVLARDRSFRGYRGFGVCRDVAAIAAVIEARRALAAAAAVPGEGSAEETSPIQAPEAQGESVPPPVEAPERESRPPRPEPPPIVRDLRAQLTIVPAAKNVVPLRAGASAEKRPALSTVERNAFQEIARALGARLAGSESPPAPPAAEWPAAAAPGESVAEAPEAEEAAETQSPPPLERAVLDRLPMATVVMRGDDVIFANRALFDLTGHESLEQLVASGGLDALFAEPVASEDAADAARALSLRTADGTSVPVDGKLARVAVDDTTAMLLTLSPRDPKIGVAEAEARAAQATADQLTAILDTATDGVLVVDDEGKVLSANRSAQALFGYEASQLARLSLLDLFAPESHRLAADYLDGLVRSGVASLLNDGREVIGRVREGGLIPLFMTMGRVADAPAKFCAVFRDITQWKRAEEELTTAKQQAEKASSAKSDFIAKISHEIRTPLNAIIGFSEVMKDERFGPIGNERYRDYARDIHASGEHMISLLSDLLDLSKIEAGKLELAFTRVDLNDVMQQCVAIMQPQANRERIIIRTALSANVPPVVADVRSVRQIALNLLSNSIKFTGAGGQVIVSTALSDLGEAIMRVRDTGAGMSEQEISTALEPFRQVSTAQRANTVGTGLGLPLTKALTEANRAQFRLTSAPKAGTLVEIVFPANRVLAE